MEELFDFASNAHVLLLSLAEDVNWRYYPTARQLPDVELVYGKNTLHLSHNQQDWLRYV